MNGYVLLVISQMMIGSIAVFARWANLPAEVLVLFRCAFAATAIGAVVLFRENLLTYLKPNKTLALLVLTGLFMASNWLYFFRAVLSTEITTAILLYNLAPIFVLLSAVVFLKEVPTARQIGCIVTALLGVLLVLGKNGFTFSSASFSGGLSAVLAGALYAQVTILGRYLKAVPALVITLFQTAVGAVLFSALSFKSVAAAHFTPMTWVILATVGVFHTAVPYLMYFKALKTVKATVAGILQYVYTLSTIVFGVIFFHESVTMGTLVGGAIIIASSFTALKYPGKASVRQLFARKKPELVIVKAAG